MSLNKAIKRRQQLNHLIDHYRMRIVWEQDAAARVMLKACLALLVADLRILIENNF